MSVYLEFRVGFDQGMHEWFCEPSSIVPVCFRNPFIRIVQSVKARGSFMYKCEYDEKGHVTGMYLSRIAVKDAIQYRLEVERRVEDSVVIHRCGDLLTE